MKLSMTSIVHFVQFGFKQLTSMAFSDLEHFDGQENVDEASTLLISYGSVDPNIEPPPPEVVSKKDLTLIEVELAPSAKADVDTMSSSKKEVVSQLAMDWDDDDDDAPKPEST